MNLTTEKVVSTENSGLATVSEVEADIREFVRKDVAQLRRPADGTTVTETALEPSPELVVNRAMREPG